MPGALIKVAVQFEDFDCSSLQEALLKEPGVAGAVASFTGYVRGATERGTLEWMELEHYPGMTEASLEDIAVQACERFSLLAVSSTPRRPIGSRRPHCLGRGRGPAPGRGLSGL